MTNKTIELVKEGFANGIATGGLRVIQQCKVYQKL